MNGKRWAALGIAAAILIISGITQIGRFFTAPIYVEEPAFWETFLATGLHEEVLEPGNPLERIVVLQVNGAIMDSGAPMFPAPGAFNYQIFLQQLDAIKEDPTIKGMLLAIDSPGGGVFESAEIKSKLDYLQDELDIPLYVSMGAVAASGGYYIAAGADQIYAAPETITGSLGVIMQGFNIAGLMEEWGISEQTVKSGVYKDIGSMTREMTESERDILQSMIDNSYAEFVAIIADGRGMSENLVREIADGRIYDGRQALEVNLIDGFGFKDDVLAAMKSDLGLERAEVFSYGEAGGFGSFFWNQARAFLPWSHSEPMALPKQTAPRLVYLYE